jgi:hypothetical protein
LATKEKTTTHRTLAALDGGGQTLTGEGTTRLVAASSVKVR